MNNYETLFICRQDISTQQVDTLADKFQEIITSDDGKLGRRENWGLRTLAYRIKKNRKGHIVLLNYTGTHTAVKEMERLMGLSEDVIRFMTTRTTELETDESIGLKIPSFKNYESTGVKSSSSKHYESNGLKSSSSKHYESNGLKSSSSKY